MNTYLAHVVANPHDLSLMNPVKMGKGGCEPEAIYVVPKLVLAHNDPANWRTNNVINDLVPIRVGIVDLPNVSVVEVPAFIDTFIRVAIGQFPKTARVNKRAIGFHNPVAEQTNMQVANQCSKRRAK